MPRILHNFQLLTCAALLGLLPLVATHGRDEDMKMDAAAPRPTINSSAADSTGWSGSEPESYFQHGGPSSLILAHILLMTISWAFVLPIGGCALRLK